MQQTDRAFISFRIGTAQWMREERFRGTLDALARHPGLTDEVALFTSETHPPLPLEEMKRRAGVMEKRLSLARERGYRAGVNILGTIGHHEENLPHSLAGDYTYMTDPHGRPCRGSYCPNDPRVQEYVREIYRAFASIGTDFIWVDDDVRLHGHMPIIAGCFCPRCIALFAEEQGRLWGREELAAALDGADGAEKLALRTAWLAHNRASVTRLLALIGRTVHAVKPGLPLGFMTGERYFEGYDFGAWAAALSGDGASEVLWRPGGGFYTDEAMTGLAGKSHEIGRQVSMLPPSVASVQSEIENFPYQRLKKAARTTALEAASHMAAGCTGAAFNVISGYDEPLDEYEALLAELAGARPLYDRLARAFGRDAPEGVCCAWSRDGYAAHNLAAGPWLGPWSAPGDAPLSPNFGAEIHELGLPAAYAPRGARVNCLFGDTVAAFGDAELRGMLSGGLFMDARALARLSARGLGALCGFSVERTVDADCTEELASHPLNAGFAGRRRDCRQSFWKSPAAALAPLSDGSRALSRLVDYAGDEVAPCAMGVYENALGGRVCVAGYCAWTHLQNLSKSTQVKAVMRWLSRDTLPLYVESYHRVNAWARTGGGRGARFALINACQDPAVGITLLVKDGGEELSLFSRRAGAARTGATGRDGAYARFTLPPMEPWEMVIGTARPEGKE